MPGGSPRGLLTSAHVVTWTVTLAAVPGLGVARGEGGREAQRVPRQTLEAVGIAHDDVRAGPGGHVQPRIAPARPA